MEELTKGSIFDLADWLEEAAQEYDDHSGTGVSAGIRLAMNELLDRFIG